MLPDIRLIAILRDPVKRAVSAVNHMIRDGLVPPIRSVDDLLGRFVHRLPWRVLEVGHYADQIEEFIDVFDRERLLVFYYEDDVVASPLECLRATCRFLGLDMIYDRERLSLQANSRRRSRLGLLVDYYVPVARRLTRYLDCRLPSYYGKPSDETRRRFYEHYAPHNERLFALLGRRPSSGWSYTPIRRSIASRTRYIQRG